MLVRALLVIVLFTPLAAVPQTAAEKKPFTFEDMMALKRLSGPEVSPDGRWVLFSAVEVDLEANTRTPHLWVVPRAGGEARQLTSGSGESRPKWAPDGKRFLYHASDETGSQVWIAEFDGQSGTISGEPRRLTSMYTETEGALWSPDGGHILFVSQVYPGCSDQACNRQRDQSRAKAPKASTFTRLLFRHWSTYSIGKRSHLFVVSSEGGEPRELTPGDHDVPPFTLGGQDMYAFSPDGQEVAYTSNIDEAEATSTNNELFVVPVAGGEARKITTNPASDSTPLYSPDGRYIAYRAQFRAGYESDRFRLMLYDRKSGEHHNLTEDFDRWVDSFAWAPDSRRIYFTAEDHGEIPIYFLEPGGRVHEVTRGSNGDLAVAPDGRTLLFSRMSIEFPGEIYRLELASVTPEPAQLGNVYARGRELSGGRPRPGTARGEPLTRMNAAVLARVHTSPLEPFWFEGAGRVAVQGFLVRPPNFDPKRRYPVKFLVHGGPQGAWGDAWSYRWNPQLFAADGYMVVMINPRGSTGYGQRFIDEINQDWGGRVYQDLMLGLESVEQSVRSVERGQVCALGASYGGYMMNWMAGQTQRFRCLVNHDGIFNLESFYGSTEELWFPEWEFGGPPWSSREVYAQWSPHNYVQHWKTPMLVVHGQLDYRIDVSEGFQTFTALQRRDIPSKMLYFPDEGHWVLKPQNSRLWYRTVNEWVDSYLK